jgi:hypothetical protein
MNPAVLTTLQYIRNTAGNATLDNLIEDHEPVGEWLWRDVTVLGFARVNPDTRRVELTEAGRAWLAEHDAKPA